MRMWHLAVSLRKEYILRYINAARKVSSIVGTSECLSVAPTSVSSSRSSMRSSPALRFVKQNYSQREFRHHSTNAGVTVVTGVDSVSSSSMDSGFYVEFSDQEYIVWLGKAYLRLYEPRAHITRTKSFFIMSNHRVMSKLMMRIGATSTNSAPPSVKVISGGSGKSGAIRHYSCSKAIYCLRTIRAHKAFSF